MLIDLLSALQDDSLTVLFQDPNNIIVPQIGSSTIFPKHIYMTWLREGLRSENSARLYPKTYTLISAHN